VTGFDDSTLPDVDFTLTVTDTLTAGGFGNIQCATKSKLDDDDFLFLELVLSTILGSIPLFLFFLVQVAVAEGANFERKEGGVGCVLADQIPSDVLFKIDPATDFGSFGKLNFLYTQLEITSAGVFAGGIYLPARRDPAVSIEGPTSVTIVAELGETSRRYHARTTDLREPLFQWTPQGTGESPSILFDTHKPGGISSSEQITVHVQDADGLEAGDEITVKIKITGGQGQPF